MNNFYKYKYLKYKAKYLQINRSEKQLGGYKNYIEASDIDENGDTMLMRLILEGNFTNIISHLGPVNYQNSYTGDTALHLILRNYESKDRDNYDKVIKLLLDNGIDPRIYNKNNESAQCMKIINLSMDSVKLLNNRLYLLQQHDSNYDSNGMTQLMIFARNLDIDNVKKLLKQGMNPNFQNPFTGDIALHYAVNISQKSEDFINNPNRTMVINLLLTYLSNPFIRNYGGSEGPSVSKSDNLYIFGHRCIDELISSNINFNKKLAHIVEQTIQPNSILNDSFNDIYIIKSTKGDKTTEGDKTTKGDKSNESLTFDDRFKYVGNFKHIFVSNSQSDLVGVLTQAQTQVLGGKNRILIMSDGVNPTNFFIEKISNSIKELDNKKIAWDILYLDSIYSNNFKIDITRKFNNFVKVSGVISNNLIINNHRVYQSIINNLGTNSLENVMINLQSEYKTYLMIPFPIYRYRTDLQKNVPVTDPNLTKKKRRSGKKQEPIIQPIIQPTIQIVDSDYKLSPGLANTGNTCFHNSTIQLLYRMEELDEFISKNNVVIQSQYKNVFIRDLIKLLNKMYVTQFKDRISETEMNKYNICPLIPTYRKGAQEDAYEFLIFILHNLIIDCTNSENLKTGIKYCDNYFKQLKYFPKDDPRTYFPVGETTTLSHITTYKLSNLSKAGFEQVFDILSKKSDSLTDVDVFNSINSGNFTVFNNDQNSYMKRKNIKSIKFSYVEQKESIPEAIEKKRIPMLNPVDISPSLKQIDLIKTQNDYVITSDFDNFTIKTFNKKTGYDLTDNKYLFIPIKRFDMTGTKNSRMFKIDEYINNNNYKLVGFVVHSGTLSGGHYWSYIKRGNIWYEYNDSVMHSVNNEEINRLINPSNSSTTGITGITPYILLYRKINGNPDISYPTAESVNPQFDKYLLNKQ